ncbi:ubiquinone/menaquinone biosynthesis C-methylase UbiE [Sphingomonas sp. F9_3S_D5_B_2]
MRNDHRKRAALWNRFYSVDWGNTATNNYGFAPADGEHPERFQHQMYLELHRRLNELRQLGPGTKVLEVSCGRGGGLMAFRSAAPDIDATGLDVADAAVAFCRRTYGESDRLRFVQGSALELPFGDGEFDVLLNVEASNDYPDREQFFREAARVLKPDGVLLYADTVRRGRRAEIERGLALAGFRAEFRNVTENVVAACRADTPRRRQVLRRHAPLPARLFLNNQLANYAALEGSSKFAAFVDGRREYLMTAASKA